MVVRKRGIGMKRLLSVFLVSVLILSLVTAQGTSEKTSEKDTSQSTVTTLSVWSFVQAHMDAYKKLSAVWNEDHPDEQIKLVDTYYDWASMHDKLYSCLLAGKERRIFVMSRSGNGRISCRGD